MANEELGTDFFCQEDITDDLAYEDDPQAAYVQACFRRLDMRSLFYANPYGVGLFRYILESGATSDDIRGEIIAALMLDDRTQNVLVTFEAQRIRIQVTPRVGVLSRFVLEIDKVAQSILEA